jgi:hypothetical protein
VGLLAIGSLMAVGCGDKEAPSGDQSIAGDLKKGQEEAKDNPAAADMKGSKSRAVGETK